MASQMRMLLMLLLRWATANSLNGLGSGRPMYTRRHLQPAVHWLITHVICVHALLQ